MRDGSLGAGAEEPKKAGVAPTARTAREREMFIGTQFSNLYTLVDTSARGRVGLNDMRRSEKAEVLEKA